MAYVFDIEANSLYPWKVTKVHCLCFVDINSTNVVKTYGETIKDGLIMMSTQDLLIGHNIISYDNSVLSKVYPSISLPNVIFDTMIASNLMFPNLREIDIKHLRKDLFPVPSQLLGSHSLKAWGYRLGIHKGTFCEETDWQTFSNEMLEYCSQDVLVNKKLYEYIQDNIELLPIKAFEIEQQFQFVVSKQIEHGIRVDVDLIQKMCETLEPERDRLLDDLQIEFPPKLVEEEFIPKRNDKTKGYVAHVPFIKRKYVPFNPNSSQQVIERLTALGWVPIHFTECGNPSTKEDHIEYFDHPSVKVLLEYKKVCNAITKLRDGDTSWFNTIHEDGRVHGDVYPFGAITRRCSHSKPNCTQLPKNKYITYVKPREIVIPTDGYVIVGCDASGLEARCLGNGTFKYDNGELANELINGDIHTKNQKLIQTVAPLADGDEGREKSKTALYATMYGASAGKVAVSLGFSKDLGNAIRDALFKAMPSLGMLKNDLEDFARKNGYIYSIDGAKVPVNKDQLYIALNYYLQGMGAIVMKVAYVNLYIACCEKGWTFGNEYAFIMYNHDEIQSEVLPEISEEFAKLAENAIIKAGEDLDFLCPLNAESKIGMNWAITH